MVVQATMLIFMPEGLPICVFCIIFAKNLHVGQTMLEILKYTLPSLIVLLAAWIVMSKQMKNEDARRNFELRKKSLGVITPIRLRGYERLALLLERITPEHILLDMNLSGMTCQEVQRQMLQTIRMEFDHNVAQQVYVGDEVWQAIVLAKEEMMRFVNTCAAQFKPEDAALAYAQMMIATYNSNGETPTQRALTLLKNEARQLI